MRSRRDQQPSGAWVSPRTEYHKRLRDLGPGSPAALPTAVIGPPRARFGRRDCNQGGHRIEYRQTAASDSQPAHRDVDRTDRQDDRARAVAASRGKRYSALTPPRRYRPRIARASKSALVETVLSHGVKLAPPGSSTDQLVAR